MSKLFTLSQNHRLVPLTRTKSEGPSLSLASAPLPFLRTVPWEEWGRAVKAGLGTLVTPSTSQIVLEALHYASPSNGGNARSVKRHFWISYFTTLKHLFDKRIKWCPLIFLLLHNSFHLNFITRGKIWGYLLSLLHIFVNVSKKYQSFVNLGAWLLGDVGGDRDIATP